MEFSLVVTDSAYVSPGLNVVVAVQIFSEYTFSGNAPEDLAKAIDRWLSLKNPTLLNRPKRDPPTWQLSATQLLNALGLKQAVATEYADKVMHDYTCPENIFADEA